MASDDRVIHTGRIPRASRAHTFYQAVADAPNPGPKRDIIWPPVQQTPSIGTSVYSDNAKHGEGI